MAFLGKGRIDFGACRDFVENWQAGDIAECVNDSGWFRLGVAIEERPGPKKGRQYVVVDVHVARNPMLDRAVMLKLVGYGSNCFMAMGFRKIRPQADEAIAADAAFIERLRPAPALQPTPTRELEEVSNLLGNAAIQPEKI